MERKEDSVESVPIKSLKFNGSFIGENTNGSFTGKFIGTFVDGKLDGSFIGEISNSSVMAYENIKSKQIFIFSGLQHDLKDIYFTFQTSNDRQAS